MKIIGCDFTSAPSSKKPIRVASAILADSRLPTLHIESVDALQNFQSFALLLSAPGPWIAGFDFPFGQPRRLIRDLNWPTAWPDYVAEVACLGKSGFRQTLDQYRAGQPAGDKEHRRATDVAARAISPMKVYGVPVGIMFCEGAPFLAACPASVLPCLPNRDPSRMVLEAYPKLVALHLVGKQSYKTDDRKKVTQAQYVARQQILAGIQSRKQDSIIRGIYGHTLTIPNNLRQAALEDTSGDTLDAILCTLQAAWAWSRRDLDFGIPESADSQEGWIVDPTLMSE